MLHLASRTPEAWLALALRDVDALLLDHAHCEKKAASTALGLVFAHPDETRLVLPLTRLAREELEHFEIVVGVLEERGRRFGRAEPTPYASRLREAVRPGGRERLVDVLLCCALIEARSCERMGMLARALPDAALAGLYRTLLASEARHHASYVALAESVAEPSDVRARLEVLAAHEARVIERAAAGPRLHDGSGPPPRAVADPAASAGPPPHG